MNVAVRGYTSIADSQFDRAEGLQLQSAAACSRHVEASATTCVPSCATDLPARATVAESRQASRSKKNSGFPKAESVVVRPSSLAWRGAYQQTEVSRRGRPILPRSGGRLNVECRRRLHLSANVDNPRPRILKTGHWSFRGK